MSGLVITASMTPFDVLSTRLYNQGIDWLQLVMQFEKKTLLFFLKKTVFYDEKNMTSEKNTEKVFFFVFFL